MTRKNFKHLLGIIVVLKGRDQQMVEVIIWELDIFKPCHNIIGIYFHTAASNTELFPETYQN